MVCIRQADMAYKLVYLAEWHQPVTFRFLTVCISQADMECIRQADIERIRQAHMVCIRQAHIG